MFTGIVIGNLGADAEVVSSNGSKFVSLSIAETRKYKREDGTTQSVTKWIDAIISNAEHPVLPYLKQGVKVCVVGDEDLRVYSSKKDRMMKAGATIHVRQIELVGGSTDDVPRQLIDPDSAAIMPVSKYYWCDASSYKLKKGESKLLLDEKNRQYLMDHQGFVRPIVTEQVAGSEQPQENSKTA